MHSLWRDFRFGVRTLLKRPGFTVAAALTLAVGIGANTAIFSVVYNLMYRSQPVPQAERLVSIVGQSRDARFHHPVSFPDYRDYRGLNEVFENATAFAADIFQLTADAVPERVLATVTSGSYFETLRLRPFLGRYYGSGEGDVGGAPVAVLGYDYWESRFAADPSIVGTAVSLNDLPVTVIGVTPKEFPGTVGFVNTQIYLPLSVVDQIRPRLRQGLEDRSRFSWAVLTRLREGVDLEKARAAVGSFAAALEKDHPETNDGLRAFVYPEPLTRLEAAAVDYMPMVAGIFMAMVSLVLVIACANVANLLLARAASRTREVAVRTALGAGRTRIARQMVTESLLLAVCGGAGGLLIAQWATRALASIQVASDIPLNFDFSLNHAVFGFAAVVTGAVGVAAGLFPGILASRANLADALKEGGRTESGAGRQPIRSALVAAQIAVSLVLLICTALFTQSFRNLLDSDPGFAVENRFMMAVDVGLRNYDEERGKAFFRDLLAAVRGLPEVRAAATARTVPVGFSNYGAQVHLEGEGEGDAKNRQSRAMLYGVVSPGYFETLGVKLAQGRPIDETDDENSRKVAVVNRKMAESLWPDLDPLGRRFSMGGSEGPFLEVVGVAENGYYAVPGESPQPFFWVPHAQRYAADEILLVHARTNPEKVLPAVREEIRKLDSNMPVYDVRTLETHYREGKAAVLFRLPALLVGAFALIGAFLAATGVYGIISYSVSQRTHEIGIRMALGATTSGIVRLISRKGLMLGLVGAASGLVLAFLLSRSLSDLLVGVGAADPVIYTAVSAAVLLIALLASVIPAALRARRIDPAVSLRGE